MAYIGFPLETAYCIASLMTGGTLTRHPRLRLAFSHGGGAFASILPRLAHGWTIKPEFAATHRRLAARARAPALLRHAGL